MEILFSGPWQFASGQWAGQFPDAPAVYRLRAWDGQANAPLAVNQPGGVDRLGILDIGETEYAQTRLGQQLAAAQGRRSPAAAGINFHLYDYATLFPLESLRVDVVMLPTKELAEAVELALIENYRWTYKTLPPLNSSAGKWRKVAAWLRSLGRQPRRPDGELNLDGLIPPHLLPS